MFWGKPSSHPPPILTFTSHKLQTTPPKLTKMSTDRTALNLTIKAVSPTRPSLVPQASKL